MGALMGFADDQPIVWPAPPKWSSPVTDSRAWLSDVLQATATGAQQVRQLRTAPRRSLSWQAQLTDDDRRVVDAVRRHLGVQSFQLPIYQDVQWLAAALAAGASGIDCDTDGYDFVVGGQAVLWRDTTTWEVVTLANVDSGALTFADAIAADWGPGDRLYPLRHARLMQPPQETQLSDDVATLQVQALIDEPCDWPAAWPTTTTYRGLHVLDWRGDEGENPTDQFGRLSGSVDADTGPIFYYDLPGMPFRLQSHRFQLVGRADHAKFWSLCYQLAGRVGQCWVPDWQMSLQMTAPITSGGQALTVAWAGITQFGGPRVNRRDLRIELYDGTVFHRRVTSSTQSGDTEVLQLDSALGAAVDPSTVRQINWLGVCASATDTVQLEHVVDASGVNFAALNFHGVANDV